MKGVTQVDRSEAPLAQYAEETIVPKLLSHKNSKHRRMIGTQGSWHPNWVQSTVPNDGQRGFHQRTEYNKRILKIAPDDVNSSG